MHLHAACTSVICSVSTLVLRYCSKLRFQEQFSTKRIFSAKRDIHQSSIHFYLRTNLNLYHANPQCMSWWIGTSFLHFSASLSGRCDCVASCRSCADDAAALRSKRVVLEVNTFLARIVALRCVPLISAEAIKFLQLPSGQLLKVTNSLHKVYMIQ